MFSHWKKKRKNPHLAFSRRNAPTCLKFADCLVGVWRVLGNCLEGVSQDHHFFRPKMHLRMDFDSGVGPTCLLLCLIDSSLHMLGKCVQILDTKI